MSSKFLGHSVWLFIIGLTSLGIAWMDWYTGNELSFFVFFFIPVGLAAWYLGRTWMLVESILCAVLWLTADLQSGHTYSAFLFPAWNTMIRLAAFISIGWAISRIRGLLHSEKEKVSALKAVMAEIKILEGFLPICSQCKKIRDADGQWHRLETYISNHTNAAFTHELCQECARELPADMEREQPEKRGVK